MALRYVNQDTLVDDLFDGRNLAAYGNLHGGAQPRQMIYDTYYRFYAPRLVQGTALAEYYLANSSIIDGSILAVVRFPDVEASRSRRSRFILSVNNVISATGGVDQRINAELVYKGREGLFFELTYSDKTTERVVLASQTIPLVINTAAKYVVVYENRGSLHFLKIYPPNQPSLNWDVTVDTNGLQAAEAYKLSSVGSFVFGMEADDTVFAPKVYRLEYTNLGTGALPTYDEDPNTPPTIGEFVADPDIVLAGTDTDLRWSTTNATEVYINGQRVAASGVMAVFPDGPSSYKLLAKNAKGLTAERNIVVYTVNANTEAFPVPTDGGVTPPPPTTTQPQPGPIVIPVPAGAAILIDVTRGVFKDTSPSPASPMVLGAGRNHCEDFWRKDYYAGKAMDAQITSWAKDLQPNWGSDRWGRSYLWRNGHSPTDGKAWRIGGLEQEMYGYQFEEHWGKDGGYPYDDVRYALNDAVKYGGPGAPWSQCHVINYGTAGGAGQSWFRSFDAPPDFAEDFLNEHAQRAVAQAANYVGYCNNPNHPLRAQYPTVSPNQPPVRFFEMGNEVPGNWERGNNRASTIKKYCFNAGKMADAMRAASPDYPIEIGFVASDAGNWNGYQPDWNNANPKVTAEKLLMHGGDKFDAFVMHPYNKNQYPVQGGSAGFLAYPSWLENVWRSMVYPLFDKYMAQYNKTRPWTLWLTEFYYPDFSIMEEHYHWRGTLFMADLIVTCINNNWPILALFSWFNKKDEQKHNQFFRYGKILTSNYKLQRRMSKTWGDWNVSCIGSNLTTWEAQLKADDVRKHGYPTTVSSVAHAASLSKDGRYLYVMLVNRTDSPQAFKLALNGFNPKAAVTEHSLSHPSMTTVSYDEANQVDFVTKSIDLGARDFNYTLQARAITFLVLENNGTITIPGGGTQQPPTTENPQNPPSTGNEPKTLPSIGGVYAPPDGVVYFGVAATQPADGTTYNAGMSQWNEDATTWKTDLDLWATRSGKKPMLFNAVLPWQDAYNENGRLAKINAKFSLNNIHPIFSLTLKDMNSSTNAELFSFSELVNGTTRDDEITAMANVMKQLARPVFISLFPDANNPENAYCPFNADGTAKTWNVTDFKNVWIKVYNLFKQAGALNVAFVWQADCSQTGNLAAANFYPGNQYVDWVSTTANVEPDAVSGTPAPVLWTTVRPQLVAFIEQAAWVGKPIMLRTGFRKDATTSVVSYADRILDFFNLVRTTNRIKALVYTNNQAVGSTKPSYKLETGSPTSIKDANNLGDQRFKEAYTEEASSGGTTIGNAYVTFDLTPSTRAQMAAANQAIVVSFYAGAWVALHDLTGEKPGRSQPLVVKEEGDHVEVIRYVPATSTASGKVILSSVKGQEIAQRMNTVAAEMGMLKAFALAGLDWQRLDFTTDTLPWSLAAREGFAYALVIYSTLFSGNVPMTWNGQHYEDTYHVRAKMVNTAIALRKGGKALNSTINTQEGGDNSSEAELLAGALLDLVNLTGWDDLKQTIAEHRANRVTTEHAESTSTAKMEAFVKSWSKKAGMNLIPRLEAWGMTFTEALKTDPEMLALTLSPATLPDPIVVGGTIPGDGSSGFSVRGRVREHGNGANVSGVTVIVGDRVTKTGLDGQFQISNLQAGQYQLFISKDGWVFSPSMAQITVGVQNPVIDVTGVFDGSQTPRMTGVQPSQAVMGGEIIILGNFFNEEDPASNKVYFDSLIVDGQLAEGEVLEASGVKLKVRVPNNIKSGAVKLVVNGRICPDTPYISVIENLGSVSSDTYQPRLVCTIRPMSSYSVVKVGAPLMIKPYIASPSQEPYTFEVDWGDGTTSTTPDPVVGETESGNKESGTYSHRYDRTGTFLVRLITTDSLNPAQTYIDTLQVAVTDQDSYQTRGLWSKLPRWLGNRF